MHTLVLSVSKAHIMSLNINTANDADLAEFLSHNGFCEADANCLQALHPHISPLLPALTEAFYERILASDAMRPFVIDRVDSLKQTHLRWMNMLFSGPFDDQFVQIHQHIGEVHLKQKIPPLFVASSMAFLRAEMPKLFTPELLEKYPQYDYAFCTSALLRLIDTCQFLVDRTYYQSLMELLGISPKLFLRLMTSSSK